MFIRQVQTPLGLLTLRASSTGLVMADFTTQTESGESSPLLEDAARQVEEWFAGRRTDLKLALDIRGTDFQRAVWQQLQAIPRGRYRTYGDIAKALGKPGAARAVGQACGANPVILFIPCHRVLAGNGRLGGFSSGLDRKRQLLKLEGIEWKP